MTGPLVVYLSISPAAWRNLSAQPGFARPTHTETGAQRLPILKIDCDIGRHAYPAFSLLSVRDDAYILRDHLHIAPAAADIRLDLTPSYSPVLSSLSSSPSGPVNVATCMNSTMMSVAKPTVWADKCASAQTILVRTMAMIDESRRGNIETHAWLGFGDQGFWARSTSAMYGRY